ncbi:hypothetical protein D3C80_2132010 [compost metagenome]
MQHAVAGAQDGRFAHHHSTITEIGLSVYGEFGSYVKAANIHRTEQVPAICQVGIDAHADKRIKPVGAFLR